MLEGRFQVVTSEGEVLPTIFREVKTRQKFGGNFIVIDQEGLVRVLYKDLSASQLRVLLGLCAHVYWGNSCQASTAELIKLLDLTRYSIAPALKALEEHGLICKVPDKTDNWEIDPLVCWRGTPADRLKAASVFATNSRASKSAKVQHLNLRATREKKVL